MNKKQLWAIAILLFCAQSAAFAVNAIPVLGGVSPNSGAAFSGQWKTFACTYSDANGASNLWMCSLLVNNTLSNTGGAHFVYSKTSNKLFMKNNAGVMTAGVTRGTAATIQSENAILDCAGTTVSVDGNTITITWRVQFKSTMIGKNCNLYMLVQDVSGGSAGWTDKGDIRVSAANVGPTLGIVTPNSGSASPGQWRTFACTYSDANGPTDLWTCSLLINNAVSNAGGAHFVYSRTSNRLFMKNNAGVTTAGVTRGTATTIQSENAILDCAGTTVSTSGNIITITWRVQFKSTMIGKNCNLYMLAQDNSGASAGWADKGDFRVVPVNAVPTLGTVSPNSGSVSSGEWQTFACTYSDANGAADLWLCSLLINNTLSHAAGASFAYSRGTNRLFMRNSTGALTTGVTRGTATTLQSESAILDCAGTTVSTNGNTITIRWRMQFKSTMIGKNCNIYMLAQDNPGAVVGWTSKGTVAVRRPIEVNAVHVAPASLTLLTGTAYTFCKAHTLDGDGQVISTVTPFAWTSQDTTVASVTNTGLSPDNKYCRATVNALKAGLTTIAVTSGGKTSQIAVKVMDNPSTTAARFVRMPLDTDPGLANIPVTQDGYRYAYFYGDPGKEYRFRCNSLEGDVYVWISSDPTFADTDRQISSGWADFTSDVVTPTSYGAYYVRMKGQYSVNRFDATVCTGASLSVNAVEGKWTRIQPNGQILYDSIGDQDLHYYYFPVKQNETYWVDFSDQKGSLHFWLDDAADWSTPLENRSGSLREMHVATQDGFYYVAVRGDYQSNSYRLCVYSPYPTVGGYQVHGSPKNIVLPAGTSRTILADCVSPSGGVATASTSFAWTCENPEIVSVTPAGLDASGRFAQATITAPSTVSGYSDTIVTVTANGVSDRISVRVVNMGELYPEAEQLIVDDAFPATVSLGLEESKLYWYQTVPGVEYSLSVTGSVGSNYVQVYTDPQSFDRIASGWCAYNYDFVSPVYAGTHFVYVTGKSNANNASVKLNTVAPGVAGEGFFPQGSVQQLTPGAGPTYARVFESDWQPDVYSFVTDEEFARFKVHVETSDGSAYVVVADNILGVDRLSGGWSTYNYEFLADTVGKRYYVLVYGKSSATHYSVTLTKPL